MIADLLAVGGGCTGGSMLRPIVAMTADLLVVGGGCTGDAMLGPFLASDMITG